MIRKWIPRHSAMKMPMVVPATSRLSVKIQKMERAIVHGPSLDAKVVHFVVMLMVCLEVFLHLCAAQR